MPIPRQTSIAFALLATLSGCAQHATHGLLDEYTALVTIPGNGDDQSVQTTVYAAVSTDSVNAVVFLRNGLLQNAADSFAKAVASDDRDFRSLYGLAVANELLGNYRDARQTYLRMNRLQPTPDSQTAIARLSVRLKIKPSSASAAASESAAP